MVWVTIIKSIKSITVNKKLQASTSLHLCSFVIWVRVRVRVGVYSGHIRANVHTPFSLMGGNFNPNPVKLRFCVLD